MSFGACITAGLVGREGFAVDASLIQADANKHRSIPGTEWNKDIDPEQARRAVKEYLATLDDRPTAQQATLRRVRLTIRSCAQWTGALRNAAFFRLRQQLSHRREVRDHHGCRGSRAIRQAEVGAAQTMIERTEACFGIKPEWLAADTAYAQPPTSTGWSTSKGSRRMSPLSTNLNAMMGHSIEKTSRSTRSATFTSVRQARFSRRRAGWTASRLERQIRQSSSARK